MEHLPLVKALLDRLVELLGLSHLNIRVEEAPRNYGRRVLAVSSNYPYNDIVLTVYPLVDAQDPSLIPSMVLHECVHMLHYHIIEVVTDTDRLEQSACAVTKAISNLLPPDWADDILEDVCSKKKARSGSSARKRTGDPSESTTPKRKRSNASAKSSTSRTRKGPNEGSD